ncbi:hypothetical protein BASA81_012112 [Batrachochytrium salamandrivorans]|nr:hypothetical protein BASA81_012112 [Batrachochytrium salamandrivorans]
MVLVRFFATARAMAKPSPASSLDIFSYIRSQTSDPVASKQLLARILGHANEFKEGDLALGVAASSDSERSRAREMIAHTLIRDIERFPYHEDRLYKLCREVDPVSQALTAEWSIGQLKRYLMQAPDVLPILPGLSSDVIACAVKLMSNSELIHLGQKVFHPLPGGSKIGSKGYFGARVQPNSPTDDPEDIFWQVLNAFSFGVGDVMLGTNPVGSDPESVLKIQLALRDIVTVFGLENVLPYCVLAHIDVQAEVERIHPGSTSLWFQSIAGSDDANQTFALPIANMLQHASSRTGKFGLYLETGQGADFTNGHGKGVDMLMHDSRKYGFARALKWRVAAAQAAHAVTGAEIYINDVAGFIGPECFRTKEQLVRVCLEDIAMGKLHGLTVGLDVCATLHMDVSLDDLEWCLNEILPANPSWAMALPTKNDPMLSYLTTSFQDHVRIRDKFQYKVDDTMWAFFANQLGVVDFTTGKPTKHFGNPCWVYLHYMRRKHPQDSRRDEEILDEGWRRIRAVQAKGVPIALGYGAKPWELNSELDGKIRALCVDAKTVLWNQLPHKLATAANKLVVDLDTQSANRQDYVFHPITGESLSDTSVAKVKQTSVAGKQRPVAIVISDGLCADAITDSAHLGPFLATLEAELLLGNADVLDKYFVVHNGRVRAGYQIGQLLYSESASSHHSGAIVHIIGERPGNGHHTFSCYMTVASDWQRKVDHDITRVVSGVADTSYDPASAARECARILLTKFNNLH